MLYFIDRGHDKPEHHAAPYHRYLICTDAKRMKWEANWSGEGAWVWSRDPEAYGAGWLLLRWKGLVIDYGHLVRSFGLPDGSHAAFWHHGKGGACWDKLNETVWWSSRWIPDWLTDAGVRLPQDQFSLDRIREPLD